MNDGTPTRVLVVASLDGGADGVLAALERAHIPYAVCSRFDELQEEIRDGAGALLISEDAIDDDAMSVLKAVVTAQPSWCPLPMILLTSRIAPARSRVPRLLGSSSDVRVLERPFAAITLVATVRAAIRARRHQYQIRDLACKLADATRQRDEFLVMLNHELRNPVAALQHATDILQHVPAEDPLLRRAREILERQVRRVTGLLDELLAVEGVIRGTVRLRRRVIDLRTVVDEAVAAVEPEIHDRGQVLEVDVPAAAVNVLGDALRLRQVLVELARNAARYTPRGGRICISLQARGRAEITIRDNGIGMEPDLLEHVFDLFVQGERSLDRTEGGLGVGLTLASGLSRMHNGTLEASSGGSGKGTTLKLSLPLLATRAARRVRAQRARGRSANGDRQAADKR